MKLMHLSLCALLCVTQIEAADCQTKLTGNARFGLHSNLSIGVPSSRATSQLISNKKDHLHAQLQLQEKQLELEEQQKKLIQEQQELERLIQQGIKEERNFSYQEKNNIVLPLGALLNLNNQQDRHVMQQTKLLLQKKKLTEKICLAENQIPADIQMYLVGGEKDHYVLKQWMDLLDKQSELLAQKTKNTADIDESKQQIARNILERLSTDPSAMKATKTWLALKQEESSFNAPLSTINDRLHTIHSLIVTNSESLREAFNYFVTNDIATLIQYIFNEKRNEALSKGSELKSEDLNVQELRTAIFNFKVKQLGNNLSPEEYRVLCSIIPTIPLNTHNPEKTKEKVYDLTTAEALIKFSKSLLKNKALHVKRIAALDANEASDIFAIHLTEEEKQAATQPDKISEQLKNLTSAEQFEAIVKKYPTYASTTIRSSITDPTVGSYIIKYSSEPEHIHTVQTILQATAQEYSNTLPSRLESPEDAVRVSRGLLHMMTVIKKRIKALHENSNCPLDIQLNEQEETDLLTITNESGQSLKPVSRMQTVMQLASEQYVLPESMTTPEEYIAYGKILLEREAFIEKCLRHPQHNPTDLSLTQVEKDSASPVWALYKKLQHITPDERTFQAVLTKHPEVDTYRSDEVGTRPTPKDDVSVEFEQEETRMSFFDLNAETGSKKSITSRAEDTPVPSSGSSWYFSSLPIWPTQK